MILKPPFPWFGGKSLAAQCIWERFGDVPNYVEPFAGSLAVLLNRPNYDPLKHTETVNDLDCYLANFWRALQHEPDAVAAYADHPVNEADLHARHLWLVNQNEFRERMMTEPEYYDAKIAGWWVWGVCSWIGSGWCRTASSPRVCRNLPHLGNNGRGVHRQLPHLGDNGRGIHRRFQHVEKRPVSTAPLSPYGNDIYEYLEALAIRLRPVRVACGDWRRVRSPSVTEKQGVTAILLDPPYEQSIRAKDLYSTEANISSQVREWAIRSGDNPMLRIALCGYGHEHNMPDSWECINWKAKGGYGGQKQDKSNNNRFQERIWFSPYCLKPGSKQLTFSLVERDV